MSVLSAEERGDMAEALLPVAAALAIGVREETPQQVASRLHSLSRHELEGLAVVLAALVDPDRSLAEALSWVNFDEDGRPLPVASRSQKRVRDVVSQALPRVRGRGVDVVAVERALLGERMVLGERERALGVDLGVRRGLSYDLLAERLGMEREAVKRSWERAKSRARAEGRWVPPVPVGEIRDAA